MRVLITGASAWNNAEAIRRELASLPPDTLLIHGDAPGADALAGQIGREIGLLVVLMRKNAADRAAYGGLAWKGLNERMLQQGIDLVLAFHTELSDPQRAHGTRHAVELAQAQGIPVRIIEQ